MNEEALALLRRGLFVMRSLRDTGRLEDVAATDNSDPHKWIADVSELLSKEASERDELPTS